MATATTRKRKRSTPASKITFKKVANKAQEPLLIVGGMVVGKFVNTFVQNLVNKAAPSEVAGLKGIVSDYAAPLTLLVAGIVAPEYLKIGRNGRISRNIGTGISVYGGFVGLKNLVGTDVLSGLKGAKGVGFLKRYRDPIHLPPRRIPAGAYGRQSTLTSI